MAVRKEKKEKKNQNKKKKNKKNRVKILLILVLVLVFLALGLFLYFHFGFSRTYLFGGEGKIGAVAEQVQGKTSYYDTCGANLLRPNTDHGAGKSTYCEILSSYAETTDAKDQNNLSNPLCSPLTRGTIDHVKEIHNGEDGIVYTLESGLKVNDADVKIIENGYTMPENRLNVSTYGNISEGFEFRLDTLWAVPVQVRLEPQEYFSGYQGRIYNVSHFMPEYMDIFFYKTKEITGSIDMSQSDLFEGYEWIAGENGGTLRLYLSEVGRFYGYSYSLDEVGRFVFVMKTDLRKLTAPTVMLDAGHGGSDPGAVGLGEKAESTLTLDITERIAKLLSERKVNVLMTRTEEKDVSLDSRIQMARSESPSLFVSIHIDSSEEASAYGSHTFYYKSYSQPLASEIQKQMAKVYQKYYLPNVGKANDANRGIKFFPFAVNRIEECPSVLVECGFISNEEDSAFLNSEDGRQKIARAIADGICDTLQGKK